jgi:hypothetical protein
MSYKVRPRHVEGDPVPLHVLAEMERHPEAAWEIRDQMLREMGWLPRPIPWRLRDPYPYKRWEDEPETSQSCGERKYEFWEGEVSHG